ncbi:hypothetical protein POPTR_010G110751v4 [Populus trichocarpa]|uniref:DNA 3'-5' helicase n=1 Tax=Populus trichocarpa TaxID=3694 RepID=A0A2K1YSC2_POPTR|nr:hypothetical protein POPTR_010G110751v4 [Populus trichocarpa]
MSIKYPSIKKIYWSPFIFVRFNYISQITAGCNGSKDEFWPLKMNRLSLSLSLSPSLWTSEQIDREAT